MASYWGTVMNTDQPVDPSISDGQSCERLLWIIRLCHPTPISEATLRKACSKSEPFSDMNANYEIAYSKLLKEGKIKRDGDQVKFIGDENAEHKSDTMDQWIQLKVFLKFWKLLLELGGPLDDSSKETRQERWSKLSESQKAIEENFIQIKSIWDMKPKHEQPWRVFEPMMMVTTKLHLRSTMKPLDLVGIITARDKEREEAEPTSPCHKRRRL